MHLFIYGSGGLGKEICDLSRRINAVYNRWSDISFIDDFRDSKSYYGLDVYRFEDILLIKENIECVIALGEPKHREILYNKLIGNNIPIATLIDPTALVSPSAKIGCGSIISALTIISSDVIISENVLIQPMVNIGHDIEIGKHSVFSSSVFPGGNSHFGNRVYVGMNSTIRENLTIEDDVIISMGSSVHRNVDAGLIVMGNPARPIQKNTNKLVFQK